MASSTQSVGVPSTAKRRGPSLRTRSGRWRVSEWLAPLCSSSGATIQTSRQMLRATLCRIVRPCASMPSSLVRRIRPWPRSIGRLGIAADHLEPAHVGLEHIRYCHGAVAPLIVLEHGDERATDREAGAVEGVHEAGPLPFFGTESRLHAPRLELAAVGAARNLAIGILAGQPDLDVIGLARGKTHVAGAEQHHPIGETETLQNLFGAGGHALVLLAGAVGMRDRDQLDLVELVLADHAARVLAGGARLGAEARRPRREAHWEPSFLDDLLGDQVGERHLRRRDEPQPRGGTKQVVGKFRQAAGAVDRVVADQEWRRYLGVTELPRMGFDHELPDRALEPRELSAQDDEARARELAGAGEIHQAQSFAHFRVIARREGEAWRRALTAELAVGVGVVPVGHVVRGNVGDARERRLDLAIALCGLGLKGSLPVFARGHAL